MLLIASDDEDEQSGKVEGTVDALRGLLAGYEIGCQVIGVNQRLPSVLTFRRTRRVIRSTPTGGVVSYEIEEEVG